MLLRTQDDDIVTISNNQPYEYRNVKPSTAVKVDEFDEFYDFDFVLQIRLKIESQNLGCIEILAPPEKGRIKEIILLWDTGEAGKYVSIDKKQ